MTCSSEEAANKQNNGIKLLVAEIIKLAQDESRKMDAVENWIVDRLKALAIPKLTSKDVNAAHRELVRTSRPAPFIGGWQLQGMGYSGRPKEGCPDCESEFVVSEVPTKLDGLDSGVTTFFADVYEAKGLAAEEESKLANEAYESLERAYRLRGVAFETLRELHDGQLAINDSLGDVVDSLLGALEETNDDLELTERLYAAEVRVADALLNRLRQHGGIEAGGSVCQC